MALDFTGTFTSSMIWTVAQGDEQTRTITEEGSISYSLSYASGHFNRVYSTFGTLSSGTSLLIDLTAMIKSGPDQTSYTISMSQLRALELVNLSNTSGEILHLFGGNFDSIYASGNGILKCGPNGFISFGTPLDGLTVTNNTKDVLRLSNPSSGPSGIQFRLSLMGVA